MAAMTPWAELRVALAFLEAAEPSPLRGYPDPRAEHMDAPFRVGFAAWAAATAGRLHERFGDDDLQLTVGVLRYPSGELRDPLGNLVAPPDAPSEPPVDPAILEVAPADPLVVASGHDLTAALTLTCTTTEPVVVEHSGALAGVVVDPETGAVVGGYSGARRLPLVRTTASPGAPAEVRLHVGTASCRGALGYAVPSGDWAVVARLGLAGSGTWRTPELPLHVVD
jgi:hypothetical protein